MNPFMAWDDASAQMRPAADPEERVRLAAGFSELECRRALRRRDIGKRERAACWRRLRKISRETNA